MKTVMSLAAVLAAASAASAQWVESGDAGDILTGVQVVAGSGPLTSISGATSVADRVDAYQIRISNPAAFFASTSSLFPGAAGATASFDTRLFLFALDGTALMGNDDFPGGSPFHSAIADPALYASTGEALFNNPQAFPAGDYVLAVSGFSNDPRAGGADIYSFASDFDALHGPATAGAVIDAWENVGASGTYNIVLSGAEFIPTPGAAALFGLAGLATARRRRA